MSPERTARLAPIPSTLDSVLTATLKRNGLDQLYEHQAHAIDCALRGRNVVVATPTASGKSLAYTLPILHALMVDAKARALLIFPTKALARDQLEALSKWLATVCPDARAVVLDGDTPEGERAAARAASVVFTTPEMLHMSILPQHTRWAPFFSELRYIVLDELHYYDGLFGANLANIFRRVERVCLMYGSRPTFIMASATIANPGEHAESMIGRRVAVVDRSGAPAGVRRVVVVRPKLRNPDRGLYEDHHDAGARAAADLLRANVPTIVFADGRHAVERVRREIERLAPGVRLAAYRGGHLPSERRQTESALRTAAIAGVVSTSALEAGVDIGQLDAVVCVGFPGSIASVQQRFGRAGRRGAPSLCVFVPSIDPLDAYIASHPELLVNSGFETARIDPDHPAVLMDHLACAACEQPFAAPITFGNAPARLLADLTEEMVAGDRLRVETRANGESAIRVSRACSFPAPGVKIRSTAESNVVIKDVTTNSIIGEIDFVSAPSQVHPGAIYLHDRRDYFVEHLDLDERLASVRPVKADHDTTAMTSLTVAIMNVERCDEIGSSTGACPIAHGDVRVETHVSAFKKVCRRSRENVGFGEVDLPSLALETKGIWLTFPVDVPGGVPTIEGLAVALKGVAAVGLMVASHDLGAAVQMTNESVVACLYEKRKNGSGLASRIFDARDEILERVRQLVRLCTCKRGCPACVGLPNTDEGRKEGVLALLAETPCAEVF